MADDHKPASRRTELSTPQKNRVKTLYDGSGWSKHAIARHLNKPRSRLLQSKNTSRDSKCRPGRDKKLSTTDIDRLVKLVTGYG